VVKTAFNQRRKTMRNSIRQMIPGALSGSEAQSEWMARQLDLRAERLSVDDSSGLQQKFLPLHKFKSFG